MKDQFSSLLSKTVSLLTGSDTQRVQSWLKVPKKRPAKELTERELIRREAAIGASLFGEIPRGHEREFFCLDADTWIWHETWVDENKQLQKMTTRYEIHENGILKVQSGPRYTWIEQDELNNLLQAMELYYQRVAREVYHVDPLTREPIAQMV